MPVEYHSTQDVFENFSDMELKPSLLRALQLCGLEKPSPLQQSSVVPISRGEDCIIQTWNEEDAMATLAMGTLNQVDAQCPDSQILLMSPSRQGVLSFSLIPLLYIR
eukprot:TRINITY_DN3135_c0_g1::TRINITY_DN3135_c0_g1_i1::g.3647::m.3647 TRINITY_DN3135_c0_g1::TRINITY_DN3135_c0_g1_i1::g.3647  ORF type:complete len:107 (+),score=-12.58,sp/Q02748/IF4A_DROME/36.90/1e-14 TRINITY_DN3135_c0_g1_i1:51-371(+)